eukprot:1144388-Pelagomonas_calceolata.AAC.13
MKEKHYMRGCTWPSSLLPSLLLYQRPAHNWVGLLCFALEARRGMRLRAHMCPKGLARVLAVWRVQSACTPKSGTRRQGLRGANVQCGDVWDLLGASQRILAVCAAVFLEFFFCALSVPLRRLCMKGAEEHVRNN